MHDVYRRRSGNSGSTGAGVAQVVAMRTACRSECWSGSISALRAGGPREYRGKTARADSGARQCKRFPDQLRRPDWPEGRTTSSANPVAGSSSRVNDHSGSKTSRTSTVVRTCIRGDVPPQYLPCRIGDAHMDVRSVGGHCPGERQYFQIAIENRSARALPPIATVRDREAANAGNHECGAAAVRRDSSLPAPAQVGVGRGFCSGHGFHARRLSWTVEIRDICARVAGRAAREATESVGIRLQRRVETCRHVLQRHDRRQLDDRRRWQDRPKSLEQIITHRRRGRSHRLGVLKRQPLGRRKLQPMAPIGNGRGLVQRHAGVVEHRGIHVDAERTAVELGHAQRDQGPKSGRQRRSASTQSRNQPEKGQQRPRPIRPECGRVEQNTVLPPLPPMQRTQIPRGRRHWESHRMVLTWRKTREEP